MPPGGGECSHPITLLRTPSLFESLITSQSPSFQELQRGLHCLLLLWELLFRQYVSTQQTPSLLLSFHNTISHKDLNTNYGIYVGSSKVSPMPPGQPPPRRQSVGPLPTPPRGPPPAMMDRSPIITRGMCLFIECVFL